MPRIISCCQLKSRCVWLSSLWHSTRNLPVAKEAGALP